MICFNNTCRADTASRSIYCASHAVRPRTDTAPIVKPCRSDAGCDAFAVPGSKYCAKHATAKPEEPKACKPRRLRVYLVGEKRYSR